MNIIRKLCFISAVAGAAILPAEASSPVSGDWAGSLDIGAGNQIAILFHITENPDGTFSGTMDSPDQGSKGIETKVRVVGEDSVIVRVASIGFKYNGKVTGDSLRGTMTQLGHRLPLSLRRGGIETPDRPQTPDPENLTYLTEEVTFPSLSGMEATLSGTLSYPEGYKAGTGTKPAAIVMVTGSGQQDRDETIFDHKPFAVIADYLARSGIATLRYDDRGTGKSTGDPSAATTAVNALDAEGALKYLRDSGRFSKIGILGHSEGGAIAFMEAAAGKADFIITLGAPAFRGDSILAQQVNLLFASRGSDKRISAGQYLRQIKSQGSLNPWIEWFVSYDPSADIAATKVPVMALGGDLDTQVPGTTNIPEIRRLLPRGKKNLVKSYPELNHLMQPAKTGQITEYRTIPVTVDETVLADIAAWLKSNITK